MDPESDAKEQRDVDPKLQYPFSFRGIRSPKCFGSNGARKDLSNHREFEIHIIARNGEIVARRDNSLELHTSCLNNSHVFPCEFYRAPRYP